MASTGSLTMTSNASAIAKKIDPTLLVGPAGKAILERGVTEGAAYLRPLVPVLTGRSKSLVSSRVTSAGASIIAPSYPLIFLERGSQAYIGPRLANGQSSRSHKRKTAKAFRSGNLRIKGRHFMRKTKAWTIRNLKTKLLPDAAKEIESRFGAL